MQVITTEYSLDRIVPPNLPLAPAQYDSRYHEALNNVLRLYFTRIDSFLARFMATDTPIPVSFPGMEADAFGRLRVGNPFTLFDSQNRYQKDVQFSESTATGATISYNVDQSSVLLNVATTSGSIAVRQTYRVFPYQPGKSLQVLCTFVMSAPQTNLRQRVGYFNSGNGVFLQQDDSTVSFVLRSSITGSPSDARTVNQADWNGDKLDGSGASGFTLDLTKSQIMFMDFEWLGVGSVRCGFVIDGQFIIAHTFQNANVVDTVYMTTAILNVRYEIEATGTLGTAATLKQSCSTVISEGGYQQDAIDQVARRTSVLGSISTTFLPLVSIRLASDSLGAVVLPQYFQVLPTTTQNYEVALIKNGSLTGASYDTTTFTHVDYDVTATAVTGGKIVLQSYVASSVQSRTSTLTPTGYNFDLQLGVDLAGVSDVYTLAIRTVSGAGTGDAIGSLAFIDLTD